MQGVGPAGPRLRGVRTGSGDLEVIRRILAEACVQEEAMASQHVNPEPGRWLEAEAALPADLLFSPGLACHD